MSFSSRRTIPYSATYDQVSETYDNASIAWSIIKSARHMIMLWLPSDSSKSLSWKKKRKESIYLVSFPFLCILVHLNRMNSFTVNITFLQSWLRANFGKSHTSFVIDTNTKAIVTSVMIDFKVLHFKKNFKEKSTEFGIYIKY